jgi:hypothetical protein
VTGKVSQRTEIELNAAGQGLDPKFFGFFDLFLCDLSHSYSGYGRLCRDPVFLSLDGSNPLDARNPAGRSQLSSNHHVGPQA